MIKRIKAKNFRSFKELDLTLENFNVFIGANASGKSNFISLFNFFRNIANHGIDDAVSLMAGIEHLKNVYLSNSDTIAVEIEIDYDINTKIEQTEEDGEGDIDNEDDNVDEFYVEWLSHDEEYDIGFMKLGFIYKLILKLTDDNKGFDILEETIDYKARFYEGFLKDEEWNAVELEVGNLKVSNITGEINIDLKADNMQEKLDQYKKELLIDKERMRQKLKKNRSILKSYLFNIDFYDVVDALEGIFSYDFYPKVFKEMSSISGKSELESDGKNFILVLKNLLKDKKKGKKLLRIINHLLPFIKDISIGKLDKYLYASVNETFPEDIYLPASLISDGTINIIALIIILYFEKRPIIILEEPAVNVHPYLISKMIDLMKEVSIRFNKQIILTTHNPEVVKYSGIEHIYFIRRDKEGFSNISKSSESKDVQVFLKNELGIDDLFVDNLLK